MDYWKECISEAFCDVGIKATDEQIENVVGWVEGAHENYGMATGQECIPNPMQSEVEQLKAAHEKEIKDRDRREFAYRKSVANRRGVSVDTVYLDGDSVIYG